VPLLRARQTPVEPAQLGIRQVRGEKAQALLAPRLDGRRDEQAIEQALPGGLAHHGLQSLRIGVTRIPAEGKPTPLDERQYLREMSRLLASEARHRPGQPGDGGKCRQQGERAGRGFLLAMSVIDDHLVEPVDRQFHPGPRRLAEKLHRRPYTAGMRIGVISDTHGLVRPEVRAAFDGVDHILHAGDIGGEEVLAELGTIAEVTACAGNNDGWRCGPAGKTARISLGGLRFLLVHVRDDAAAELRRTPADVVVFGHSHKPADEHSGGVWGFNPGSAGPRRFSLPVCVGLLEQVRGKWRARHIGLQ
jgi:putative phosphoesterase